jgi:hypothetical protein
MDYYNTKIIDIGSEKYCVYCGEKAKNDYEYADHYYRCDYYFCDCDGAKAEKKLNDKIEKLKREYESQMQENVSKINELKYQYEVQKLKHKYNIK